MLTYKKADLLTSGADIIAHGVNCKGVMGAGVALAIRNKHPYVFDRYKSLCHQGSFGGLLGGCQMVYDQGHQVTIANLFTQQSTGGPRAINYEAIYTSLRSMYSQAHELKLTSVAMPMIGAGLGGGDWNIIEQMITSTCQPNPSMDTTIYHR